MRRLFFTFIILLASCSVFAQTREELYDRFGEAISEHDTTAVASLILEWEKLYPNDAELFSLRANYYFMDAVADVVMFSDKEPDDDRECYVMQDSLGAKQYIYYETRIDSAKLDLVKATLAEGITRHPNRIDLRLGKVTVHLKAKENALAVEEIYSALKQSVANSNKWIEALDAPIETDGVSYLRDCIQDYFSQLLDADDFVLAEEMTDSCVRFYPQEAIFLTNKGTVRYFAGDMQGALGWYLSARELSPYDILIANNIANVYVELGNKQDAIKYYRIVADSNDERFAEKAKLAIKELGVE